ncbi:hypothetical protein [Aequorivita lipolytica]|uniref:Uncharacterized protein n=1 Tax=Aequorivita lipolytica TaxID=153267 RepID=A0A5C6YSD6_9FLAO|nr:hypothetical protein [Aequorivita lipolytica]TXD69824.1 hypothetical protein ESV24_05120 [Aequorivita lipolytica]SRX50365.1 hypothetical protein AEQU2_00837 [Aequorivita lipolytica]
MTLIFIGIPLVLIWMIHKFLKKKTTKRTSIIITSFLFLIFSYFLFRDFYPTNNFYLNDYKEKTNLQLPNSAKLIEKKGSNSIFNFGDYNISYTIELAENDFDLTHKELQDKGFKENKMYLETPENEFLLSQFQDTRIEKILVKDYGFKNYEILFMDNNKTIICNSNKW